MPSPPRRLLIVTYRYGAEIRGGAERYIHELANRLQKNENIQCEIWTTTGLDIQPVTRWGTLMRPGFPAGEETTPGGLRVRRFPLAPWPRVLVALAGKAIQRRWEYEENRINCERLLPYDSASDLPDPLVGPGWHHPEPQPDGALPRWMMPRAVMLRKAHSPAATLELRGFSPRRTTLRIAQDAALLSEQAIARGWFHARVVLPPAGPRGSILRFECSRAFRPLRDHRTLGLLISSVSLAAEGGANSRECPLWDDYRGLLRRRWDDLMEVFLERGRTRPALWGRLFDFARGPRCPGLAKALCSPEVAERFDAVLGANLPWAIVPLLARVCPLPMAALAFWHLDDDYYYWNHYIESLRKARVVLSMTQWGAGHVWPRLGIEACWAGAGVDERWRDAPARMSPSRWRESLGLPPESLVILSVARKSPSKRYDLLIAALGQLRQVFPRAVLVLAGPDEDHRPITAPGVHYIGAPDDEQLHEAYCNADVFAMMSESESFGMVFIEAWLRGLPVIGNRWCRPVASLIEDGRDGFLASTPEEIAAAIFRLFQQPELRRTLGAAGKEKTLRDHTWEACTKRVARALDTRLFSTEK